MTFSVRPPSPPTPMERRIQTVLTIISAVLALYLTVTLVVDTDKFTPEQVSDLVVLAGILWAVPTIIVAAHSICIRIRNVPKRDEM